MLQIDINDLRSRGYIGTEDIQDYFNYSKSELIQLLKHKEPISRSIAAKVLAAQYGTSNEATAELLLECINKEKKLYTRIEMCSALETGNEVTAKMMTKYLGKIGRNQHRILPERPSMKKSFPLPRDLISRSLGRMSPKIIGILNEVLDSKDAIKISEVIDAIGFLIFYNPSIANHDNFHKILKTIEIYKDSSVIMWKCILCLSAFPLKENIEFLNTIIIESTESLYIEEAKRAIKIINGRR